MRSKKKIFFSASLAISAATCAIMACSDDNNNASSYDANLPVTVNEIFPSTGGYFEKVILRGENFGNDPKKIRVFFNRKEAMVIGASGDRVLVYAPKLPGEDCKIGMLMNGNTTDTIFAKEHFNYVRNYQLQYVAGQLGSNSGSFDEGELQSTTFANGMQYLACDPHGTIYMNHKGTECKGSIIYINEPENYTKFMVCGEKAATGGEPQAPWYDNVTKKVYFAVHQVPGFWEVDPEDSWSFIKRQVVMPDSHFPTYRPLTNGTTKYVYSFARGHDGYIYTRSYAGTLFRFKLDERVYDVVKEDLEQADAYICSDPDDPTKIYCSLLQLHVITCIDLSKDPSDPEFETVVCGTKRSGDYQDGPVGLAKLNKPQQIVMAHDPETGEKIIYICDSGNNCVRKFNMDTNMMSTVAGVGKQSGYAVGIPTISKMKEPVGICLSPENDLYIADRGNKVIMKLAFL